MPDVASDLLEIWRTFKAMPPIVVAVWCVDRPDALGRIRQLIETAEPPSGLPFAAQVPVYTWSLRFATLDDLAKRPSCFLTPGVYLEMSNGEYGQVNI